MSEWFNVRSLGQNPDLQTAVNEHRVLYFPMGTYRAAAPLILKPDTVLIGLHCTRTTVGAIASPKGGSPLISGLGFSGIAGSPNILWNSGERLARQHSPDICSQNAIAPRLRRGELRATH